MSKRLEVLKKVIASGSTDPFARYGLAMELKSLGRLAESLTAFEELRAFDRNYTAQYLMAGGVAEALGQKDVAIAWYDQGIELAQKKGESHALGELSAARALLDQ